MNVYLFLSCFSYVFRFFFFVICFFNFNFFFVINHHQFIVTANYDPSVFKDPWKFDPTRKNLDKVLSWNGPVGSVGMGIAATPRGCPGHSISLAVAEQVVERFRPKDSSSTEL